MVEEIWRKKSDASSEEFEEIFRIQGQRLLDGKGDAVDLELGDKLELICQNSRI